MANIRQWKIIKTIFEWAEHLALLREWVLPALVPLITAALGYYQSVPWMWVAMATTLTTMGFAIVVFVIMLQSERNNPLNKLQWIVVFQCDITPATMQPVGNRRQRLAQRAIGNQVMLSSTQLNPSVSRTIDKGQLGIELLNTANFPISCILFSANTDIEEIVPPRSIFPKAPYLLAPGARIRLCDDPIDMEQHQCGKLLGKVDIVIKYGKPGKESCEIKVDCKVNVIMEHYGFVSQLIMDFTKTTS